MEITKFYNDEPYGTQFTIFMLSRMKKIILTTFFCENEVITSIVPTNLQDNNKVSV